MDLNSSSTLDHAYGPTTRSCNGEEAPREEGALTWRGGSPFNGVEDLSHPASAVCISPEDGDVAANHAGVYLCRVEQSALTSC